MEEEDEDEDGRTGRTKSHHIGMDSDVNLTLLTQFIPIICLCTYKVLLYTNCGHATCETLFGGHGWASGVSNCEKS